MSKLTKNQKIAYAKVEPEKAYKLTEAAALLKEITFTKFDASVDVDEHVGAWIEDPQIIVEKDFVETLSKCQKISLEECKKFPLFDKVAGKILRLIAPLM